MNTYLFDFDGTLVDSMPTYCGVMLRILDETHTSYASNIMKIITPLGYAGTAAYFKQMGVPLTEQAMIGRMHAYAREEYALNVPAKAHVVQVLQTLKNQGASLNVLTASPHEMLDPCLKRLGIWDLFDHVWSCEDFGTTKADPAIYHMAAEQIGKPIEEILFLDDNFNADQTAKQAGMQVCGVYDASSDEYRDEMKALCHYYIDDFSQLLEIR